ncbi:MAG: 2-oxo acid dehydrogenase subunit E2, partial [Chloroflexota bacterium]
RQTVAKVVPPEMGDYNIYELSRMRMAIARHTSESKRTIPHYYVTATIDMTQAMHLRESLNETLEDGGRISINDMLVKATAMALTKFPTLNATFAGDQLHIFRHINIGIIVAVEEGLIIPVIDECDKKSIKQLAVESKDLIARAKEGKLRADEYADATFTISNLGMYAVDSFIPIINPPEVGILGIGSVHPEPVARDGAVLIDQVMKVTLAADHRATDGALGARFLTELKTILENPMSLLL